MQRRVEEGVEHDAKEDFVDVTKELPDSVVTLAIVKQQQLEARCSDKGGHLHTCTAAFCATF